MSAQRDRISGKPMACEIEEEEHVIVRGAEGAVDEEQRRLAVVRRSRLAVEQLQRPELRPATWVDCSDIAALPVPGWYGESVGCGQIEIAAVL